MHFDLSVVLGEEIESMKKIKHIFDWSIRQTAESAHKLPKLLQKQSKGFIVLKWLRGNICAE